MVRRRLPAPIASLATPKGTLRMLLGSLDGAAFEDTDVRQRKFLIAVLISIFINGCLDASTSSQSHAATAEESTPQAAEPSAASGRVGSGTALRVNFTEAAKSADARTRAPSNPDVGDRGELLELPSVPTTGTRKQASTPGFATPQTFAFVPVSLQWFPAHSMASLKAVAPAAPIRHRTLTPLSARARSSKLSTT